MIFTRSTNVSYKNIAVHKDNITWLIIFFILFIPPVCLFNNIDMKVMRSSILITHIVFNICSLSLLCQRYHVIEYFKRSDNVFLCAYCLIFFYPNLTQQCVWTCLSLQLSLLDNLSTYLLISLVVMPVNCLQ